MAEEIVVTGERLDRPWQQTSSSVAVFDAQDLLGQAGTARLDDVLKLIPNVQFGSTGLGPSIRGQDSTGVLQDLPAFLGGTRPRVTVQVDGRAVGFNEFVFGALPLWDVAQVEVFRSPQTTTQGRNAIAGSIFIATKDPGHEYEGRGRVIVGGRDLRQASAAVGGPLINGQLAFRIAADTRRERPGSRIADRVEGADPGHQDHQLIRAKLLFEPAAVAGLSITTTLTHTGSTGPQIEGVRVPFQARRDPLAGYGVFDTRTNAATVVAKWRTSARFSSRMTLSAGRAEIDRFAPPGSGIADNDASDRSIELTGEWRPDDTVRLVAGVHHLRTTLDQRIDLSAIVGLGRFDDVQRSSGIFGELSAEVMPGATLAIGVRRQRDRQLRSGSIEGRFGAYPLAFSGQFDALLPKFTISIEPSSNLTVGALVQKAYNPGGVTLNFDTGQQSVFGAETLWSGELFARWRLPRSLGAVGLNIFSNRFRNAQRARSRLLTVPGAGTLTWAEIENVPRARSRGMELEVRLRPTTTLEMRAAAGLLDTRITEGGGFDLLLGGKRFARAPARSASVGMSWQAAHQLRLSGNLRHHSGYFSNDANTPSLAIDPATTVDARSDLTIGRLTLFGYARNVFNDFALTSLFRPDFGTANEPRTIGLGLSFDF